MRFGNRLASIKSQKARSYAAAFEAQVQAICPMLEGELRMDAWVWYSSQRPDLDESLILDLLQGKVYLNDRQVRERHIHHGIDRENPRIEVFLRQRDPLSSTANLERLRLESGTAPK